MVKGIKFTELYWKRIITKSMGAIVFHTPHGRRCKTISNMAMDYFTFVLMNIPLVNLGLVDDLASHNFLLRSVRPSTISH